MRVQLHIQTGQPLEYYDEMTLQDLGDILSFLSGKAKAEQDVD